MAGDRRIGNRVHLRAGARIVITTVLAVCGMIVAVSALEAGREYARLRKTIRYLESGSFGSFTMPSVEGFAKPSGPALGSTAAGDQLIAARLMMFIGSDPASVAFSEEWAAAIAERSGDLSWDVTVVSLGGAPLPPRLVELTAQPGMLLRPTEAQSAAHVFANMGITVIPSMVAYDTAGLRCMISGRSSRFTIQHCTTRLGVPSNAPVIEYSEGISLLGTLGVQRVPTPTAEQQPPRGGVE